MNWDMTLEYVTTAE